jgi:hypothetical protein
VYNVLLIIAAFTTDMDCSSSSASESDDTFSVKIKANKGKSVKKVFVVSERKFDTVPRKTAWTKLMENGRVRELSINISWSANMLMYVLQDALPCLQGKTISQ